MLTGRGACRRRVHQIAWVFVVGLLVLRAAGPAHAAEENASPAGAPVVEEIRAPESYGGWVLAPALVAIVCAMVTRQVVPALLLGVLVGSMLLYRLEAGAQASVFDTALGTIRLTVEGYVVGALADADHVKIIVFTMMIAGMVGIVAANGGTAALVDLIARRASNRARGQVTAWAAGLVVFFDDYANTMIVGPTMQPICDRLRISRAKLAYIVDSTAAPVASIALVGTWVGAELGYIGEGLADARSAGLPGFLEGVNAWSAFVRSIPYRFYAVLAIVMVLLVSVTGRDIGPMRKHEERAAREGATRRDGPRAAAGAEGRWWLAAVPILTLVVVTGVVLLWPGLAALRAAGGDDHPFVFGDLFEGADSHNAILYGAAACVVTAIALAVVSRRASLGASMDAMVEGMSRVFPAIVVLVLAWALSRAGQDLHVGEVVSGWLNRQGFSIRWLPLAVFVSAAGVSFATGTSWGTMGILCPMVVRVAADLGAALPAEVALPLFYGSVGSVLAGAIFGDHCSPISDTTVLSSIASGCTLETHVWTQIPYALVTAAVSMVAGDMLCSKFGQSPWLGLLVGMVLLYAIMRLAGRTAVGPPATPQ